MTILSTLYTDIRQLFEDPDGTLSIGKIAFAAAAVVVLACGMHVLLKTHAMPDWSGGTIFLSALYGLDKGAEVITSHPSWNGKSNSQNPTQ
jgi:hypothetical protein